MGQHPFLNNDYSNCEEVRRPAQDQADAIADASDLQLRKPFTIPQQFYEIWLGHERRRQADRDLAIAYIRQDPLGALERAYYRIVNTLWIGEYRADSPHAGSILWRTLSALQPIDRMIVLLGTLVATIMLAVGVFSAQARLFVVGAWCGWLPIVIVASLGGRVMLPSVLFLTAAVATMLSDVAGGRRRRTLETRSAS